MKPSTEWMLRIAAVVVALYFGWTLVATSVIQMVNLSLANKAMAKSLAECQGKMGMSQSPGRQ